jgi:hypothetical protein
MAPSTRIANAMHTPVRREDRELRSAGRNAGSSKRTAEGMDSSEEPVELPHNRRRSSRVLATRVEESENDSDGEFQDNGADSDFEASAAPSRRQNDNQTTANERPRRRNNRVGLQIVPTDWVILDLHLNQGFSFQQIHNHFKVNYPNAKLSKQSRRNCQIRHDKLVDICRTDNTRIPVEWESQLAHHFGGTAVAPAASAAGPAQPRRYASRRRTAPQQAQVDEDIKMSDLSEHDDEIFAVSPPPSPHSSDEDASGEDEDFAGMIEAAGNQSAHSQLQNFIGIGQVEDTFVDWTNMFSLPLENFRYFVKMRRSDWPTDDWQRLHSVLQDMRNVVTANEWAHTIAQSQANLFRFSRVPPKPVRTTLEHGMHSYRVDTARNWWVVEVDREPVILAQTIWEVRTVTLDVSHIPREQLPDALSRTPDHGQSAGFFSRLEDANAYAGVSFWKDKIQAENLKFIGGLSLESIQWMESQRELSIQYANNDKRPFQMYAELGADQACIWWVHPWPLI